MGVGAAMVFPSTLSLITNVFTERRRARPGDRPVGRDHRRRRSRSGRSSAAGCSSVSDWRSIFFAMAPVAAVAGVLGRALRADLARPARAAHSTGAGFALSTAMIGAARLHDHRGPEPRLGQRADARRLRADGGAGARRSWPGSGAPSSRCSTSACSRNPRFTAASASVTISFFALSGFIFLITQYFQFLKGYGPLSTGVRLLPVASFVAIASILGTKLAVRFGTKLVVASGLFSMAAFYLWVATIVAHDRLRDDRRARWSCSGPGWASPARPATEAIMGVVPKAKAGVGSAVNDATRLLGGTLGVAVIGSVYASLYASRLTSALPRGLPAGVARAAHESVGAALTAAGRLDPRRPSGARVGRPQRRQLGVLPRLPHRQLRRRGHGRRRRRDGAGAAARPPDDQQR